MGGAAALVHVYPNGNYKLHLGAVLVQCVPEEILTSLDSAAAATAHSLASSEAAASWRARAQPTAGGTDADGNAAAGNDSGELSPGADDSGGSGSGSPMRGPQNEEHAAGGFAAQMAAAANAGSSGGAPAGIGTAEQVQHTAHAAQQQQQSAGRAKAPSHRCRYPGCPTFAAAGGTAPAAAAAERGTAAACSNSHPEGCRSVPTAQLRSCCKLMLTRNASCFEVSTNECRGIESRLGAQDHRLQQPLCAPAAQAQTQLQRSLLQVCIILSSTVEHASVTSFMARHQQPDALGVGKSV